MEDLLLCAKHLFVAAIGGSSTRHWGQDSRPNRRAQGVSTCGADPGAAARVNNADSPRRVSLGGTGSRGKSPLGPHP
jgi:hypothetical protein